MHSRTPRFIELNFQKIFLEHKSRSQAHGSCSVCGSSPAWCVSGSFGLMKFYTVCLHQPLIFEWVRVDLFICHLHYLFSPLKCWFLTGQTAEWYLTSVNYWLVIQCYVQFLQRNKNAEKSSWFWRLQILFVCTNFLGREDFFFLHAHLTLHEFCFLGRKDILWFHLQMA